jgi:hypothetical protein
VYRRPLLSKISMLELYRSTLVAVGRPVPPYVPIRALLPLRCLTLCNPQPSPPTPSTIPLLATLSLLAFIALPLLPRTPAIQRHTPTQNTHPTARPTSERAPRCTAPARPSRAGSSVAPRTSNSTCAAPSTRLPPSPPRMCVLRASKSRASPRGRAFMVNLGPTAAPRWICRKSAPVPKHESSGARGMSQAASVWRPPCARASPAFLHAS